MATACAAPATSPSVTATGLQQATVTHVVDGDTIWATVDGREERIRYIGIDAPELGDFPEPFGREAREANEQLVGGQAILLERDVSDTDRFGRLLRYVWLPDAHGQPSVMVNVALVRGGFAHARTYPPDVKHQELFRVVEREARETDSGLWGASSP